MKKCISILLMALLLAGSVYASADTEDESVAGIGLFYVHTRNIFANLSISSDGNATSSGIITLRDPSYTCSITVSLQRKSGNSWTTIGTWSGSGNGYAGASAGGTKKVASGYSYRVSVSTVVKNSSGSVIETPSKSSATKSY